MTHCLYIFLVISFVVSLGPTKHIWIYFRFLPTWFQWDIEMLFLDSSNLSSPFCAVIVIHIRTIHVTKPTVHCYVCYFIYSEMLRKERRSLYLLSCYIYLIICHFCFSLLIPVVSSYNLVSFSFFKKIN